ncbi:TetR family transcriptional regulator [Termitidicoccus mucosus]|uniref:TetR family transcriptional regulator n=1 Tax=Termitidicoccus mucosus TaxID=1184151 RepID=A0A178IM69_9BACT|nr:TetR family transcriptional regulator [Opitutaceae bacterium TSB47]
MEKTTRPRRLNRSGVRARAQILLGACKVFAIKGYGDASIRDIANEADVIFGSVIYHFGSKEKLFIEAVRRYFLGAPPLVNCYNPVLELGGAPSPQEVADAIHETVRQLIAAIHAPQSPEFLNGLILRVLADGHKGAQTLILEHFAPYQYRVMNVLARVCPNRIERDLHAWFDLFWAQFFYPITTRSLRLLDHGRERYSEEWLRYVSHRIAWYLCMPLGLPEPTGRVDRPVRDSIKARAAARALGDDYGPGAGAPFAR